MYVFTLTLSLVFIGSNESDLNRVTGRVPNTNMHSVEGSNPIWMQAYENEWYKEDDSVRYSSQVNSEYEYKYVAK